ncbi:MAG: RidA family protein [Bryobacteraceae bacterium]
MKIEQIKTNPTQNPSPFSRNQAGQLALHSSRAGYGRRPDRLGGFRAQGEQAFENLSRALEAGGSDLKHVVKVTVYLTDMDNFKEVVELRRQFFSLPYPADTILEISGLYTPEAMIEIEAIALVTGSVS